MEGKSTLASVGLAESEERVYRALLRTGGGTPSELSAAAGVSAPRLPRLLRELETKGLVVRSPRGTAQFIPLSPDVALGALISRRREEIDQAHETAMALLDEYRTAAKALGQLDCVEVIAGRSAFSRAFDQLKRGTSDELVLFDKPPYSSVLTTLPEPELDLLRRGAKLRVVYDREVLDLPGRMEWIEALVAAGEEARVAPVPAKLAIADRRLGLVPLVDDTGVAGGVLIHVSPLLDALITLFEAAWDRGVPLRFHGPMDEPGDGVTGEDRRLLALLAAGMKDAAIARQLAVGLRTVRRRVARLMDELGAETRFHAAALAARRGWLE